MSNTCLTPLMASILTIFLISGCVGRKKDPLLEANPYEKLAFYGRVIDQESLEAPLYPIKIFLEPDDPGRHVIADAHIFFIEEEGLEPIYDYTLKIRAQYYSEKEIPLKYVPGRAQDLGVISIKYIEARITNGFVPKPFRGFTPGSAILDSPGWSISSFINHWESIYGDQPFKLIDVEQYVKKKLPEDAPEVSGDEIRQAIKGWLDDGLIYRNRRRDVYILR